MEEFANFSAVFVDGTSRFTTGQFVAYAGGWACARSGHGSASFYGGPMSADAHRHAADVRGVAGR